MFSVLLVGLGNPGSRYVRTRHNIGFLLIDAIARKFMFPPFLEKFDGAISKGVIDNCSVCLFKPLSFMNLSGVPVLKLLSFYKLKPESLFVLHDDLDVQFGKIKIKFGGGAAGHKGIKSIDENIGNSYWRLRFGVGRPVEGVSVPDYVLKNFEDEKSLNLLIEQIANNIRFLFSRETQNNKLTESVNNLLNLK